MPLLGIQYTDQALVALAKRMGVKWSGPKANPDEKIRALWARMDRDASGELDAAELRAGLSAARMDASEAGMQVATSLKTLLLIHLSTRRFKRGSSRAAGVRGGRRGRGRDDLEEGVPAGAANGLQPQPPMENPCRSCRQL